MKMAKTVKTVILLNGLPRAGKDTAADFMVQQGYEKLSFAAPMKRIISHTFNISLEELDEYKNESETYELNTLQDNDNIVHITNFRKILQRFGTEGMKPEFGDSVWADLTYDSINKSDAEKTVIADFRFLVEYQQPEDTKVISVLIKDKRELPLEGHASDIELYQNNFKFDYIIENTGTLEELEEKIKYLLVQLDRANYKDKLAEADSFRYC